MANKPQEQHQQPEYDYYCVRLAIGRMPAPDPHINPANGQCVPQTNPFNRQLVPPTNPTNGQWVWVSANSVPPPMTAPPPASAGDVAVSDADGILVKKEGESSDEVAMDLSVSTVAKETTIVQDATNTASITTQVLSTAISAAQAITIAQATKINASENHEVIKTTIKADTEANDEDTKAYDVDTKVNDEYDVQLVDDTHQDSNSLQVVEIIDLTEIEEPTVQVTVAATQVHENNNNDNDNDMQIIADNDNVQILKAEYSNRMNLRKRKKVVPEKEEEEEEEEEEKLQPPAKQKKKPRKTKHAQLQKALEEVQRQLNELKSKLSSVSNLTTTTTDNVQTNDLTTTTTTSDKTRSIMKSGAQKRWSWYPNCQYYVMNENEATCQFRDFFFQCIIGHLHRIKRTLVATLTPDRAGHVPWQRYRVSYRDPKGKSHRTLIGANPGIVEVHDNENYPVHPDRILRVSDNMCPAIMFNSL